MAKEQHKRLTAEETAKRMEEALRRALVTPPRKPKKPKPKVTSRKPGD